MPETPDLTAMTYSDTALALILQACGREVDQHVAAFLDGHDLDSLRKARVALRRLTTALDAFAPILRKSRARKLRRRVKKLFWRLGALTAVIKPSPG